MNLKQKERWGKIRVKGKSRFIWVYGVLGWGVSTAILFSVLTEMTKGWFSVENHHSFLIRLPISLVLFSVGGYFWGLWTWRISEKKYLSK